jgi:hypothetical protein
MGRNKALWLVLLSAVGRGRAFRPGTLAAYNRTIDLSGCSPRAKWFFQVNGSGEETR